MAGKKGGDYSGNLATPFPPPKKGDDNWIKEVWPEWDKRFDLLFDHYGIREPGALGDAFYNRYQHLAICLALNHVPGLQSQKRTGRPKTWGDDQIVKLYAEVVVRVHGGQSESQACYHLAERTPWNSFLQSKGTTQQTRGRTLLRRFKKIQSSGHNSIELLKKQESEFSASGHLAKFDNWLRRLAARFNF